MQQGSISCEGRLWMVGAERARSFAERFRGLLGRDALGPGRALLIERCGAIHTVGMRFAIDAVFLDRGGRVVRIVRNVRPGRLMVWGGVRAARVVECETGCVDVEALRLGERLVWSV